MQTYGQTRAITRMFRNTMMEKTLNRSGSFVTKFHRLRLPSAYSVTF